MLFLSSVSNFSFRNNDDLDAGLKTNSRTDKVDAWAIWYGGRNNNYYIMNLIIILSGGILCSMPGNESAIIGRYA